MLSKTDYAFLAKKIKEDIFRPASTYKTTVFLCGADIKQHTTLRYKIAQILSNNLSYSLTYDLVYPEDIFEELLYGSKSADLLSLENLLADSVDAVVVIPESAGSFAELGAFANNEKLRNKLICVVDEKYKKNKSFINQGPLKLVKNTNKDAVVFIDINELGKGKFSFSDDSEVDKITASIKKLKRKSSSLSSKLTLLQIDKFLLPVIYLLEMASKEELIEIVSNAIDEKAYASNLTTTALTILTTKRYVELTTNGYKLTVLGNTEFLSFRNKSSRVKQLNETIAIDNLRLEILNLKNRKKRLKV